MKKHFKKLKSNIENHLKKYPLLYELLVHIPKRRRQDKKTRMQPTHLPAMLEEKPFKIFYCIAIETMNRCNGECRFCPVNRFDDPREFCQMSDETFNSLIDQLAELNFDGVVFLYSNNEPLMDSRISEFARTARTKLPLCKPVIYTNGTLLTIEKFESLIDNLAYLCIDNYYDDEPALLEPVREVIEYIVEKRPELQSKVTVHLIGKNAVRNRRGGKDVNRKFSFDVKSPCVYPFYDMFIRADGDVTICGSKPYGEPVFGNINTDKLIDVWNGEEITKARETMLKGRNHLKYCRSCDNFHSPIREEVYYLNDKDIRERWGFYKKLLRTGKCNV